MRSYCCLSLAALFALACSAGDSKPDEPTGTLDDAIVQSLRIAIWSDPSTTMGVAWKSEADMPEAVVEYGLDAESLEQSAAAAGETFDGSYQPVPGSDNEVRPTWVFRARIEGLTPDTTYFYRVRSGDKYTTSFSFTTAPPKGARVPVDFIAMGDNRGITHVLPSPDYPLILSQVKTRPYDFLLNTGDMTFTSLQSEWDYFFLRGQGLIESRPWLMSEGNHDAALPGSFLKNNFLPQNDRTYYSLDYANLHIVALDTQDPTIAARNPPSAQVEWLRADLAATDQDWILIFFHKAPYNSSGTHGSQQSVQEGFVDVLDEFGADVAYMGHDHIYDRTQFLFGRTPRNPENILPEGGGTLPAEMCASNCARGTMYVTTGGAGAPLYHLVDPLLDFTAAAARAYHFVAVSIDGDHYSQTAFDEDGNTLDTFEFTRIP